MEERKKEIREINRIFPISSEIISVVQGEIERNPDLIFKEELKKISEDNPELITLLTALSTAFSGNQIDISVSNHYSDGIIWMYRFIRTHLKLARKMDIPKLDEESIEACMRSREEEEKEAMTNGLTQKAFYQRLKKKFDLTEPLMGEALDRMSVFRGDQHLFFAGALNTYYCVKWSVQNQFLTEIANRDKRNT